MLRPLFWLIRWMFALALLAFTVAALRTALAPLAGLRGWGALAGQMAAWVFLGGFAARWLLARLPGGDPLEFLDTLEHELTHAVAGYLTFAPPVSLTATLRGGGEVELKRSNPVAALAPYCLPLYAALLAGITLVIRDGWIHQARLAVAFVLGSFAWRLLREFHFGQTDFRAFGLVFSMVFIAAALPLCLLGVLDGTGLIDVRWVDSWRLSLHQAGGVWQGTWQVLAHWRR
jgi:hypothetical protein